MSILFHRQTGEKPPVIPEQRKSDEVDVAAAEAAARLLEQTKAAAKTTRRRRIIAGGVAATAVVGGALAATHFMGAKETPRHDDGLPDAEPGTSAPQYQSKSPEQRPAPSGKKREIDPNALDDVVSALDTPKNNANIAFAVDRSPSQLKKAMLDPEYLQPVEGVSISWGNDFNVRIRRGSGDIQEDMSLEHGQTGELPEKVITTAEGEQVPCVENIPYRSIDCELPDGSGRFWAVSFTANSGSLPPEELMRRLEATAAAGIPDMFVPQER